MVKMKTDGGGEGRSEKEAAVAKGKGLVEGLVMKTNGKMEVEELPSPEQLKGAKGRMITLRMPIVDRVVQWYSTHPSSDMLSKSTTSIWAEHKWLTSECNNLIQLNGIAISS